MGLRELRIKHSYSQEKLADLANLSTRTIQRIEKEHKAGGQSINALAKVFDMSASGLKQIVQTVDGVDGEESRVGQKSFLAYFMGHKNTHIFIGVNIAFFVINMYLGGHLWFIYPLFIWGYFHTRKLYDIHKKAKMS